MHSSTSVPLVRYGGSSVMLQAGAWRQRASWIWRHVWTPTASVPHAPAERERPVSPIRPSRVGPMGGVPTTAHALGTTLVAEIGLHYDFSVLPAMVLAAGYG